MGRDDLNAKELEVLDKIQVAKEQHFAEIFNNLPDGEPLIDFSKLNQSEKERISNEFAEFCPNYDPDLPYEIQAQWHTQNDEEE